MKFLIRPFLVLLLLVFSVQLHACTMEPSVWQTVDTADGETGPGVFALSDALYQLRGKFLSELAACQLPDLPVIFVGAFYGNKPAVMSARDLQILEQSIELIWKNTSLLPASELLPALEDYSALQVASTKAGPKFYTALIHISAARSSAISQIDLNFWLYQLYRCVLREELKVLLRIADSTGTAVFIDEISVSPTVIVDPVISPLGGYIIRFEKNTATPLMVDFGPLSEGGEHVLRFNDAFHQPFPTPPLPEFNPPAMAPATKPHQTAD